MFIDDKSVQRFLAAHKMYSGNIDGDFGPKSQSAADRYIDGQHLNKTAKRWGPARARVAIEQAMMAKHGFYTVEIDGLVGPVMQVAAEKWQDWITFTRKPLSNKALVAAGGPNAMTIWPRQADLVKFYGKPGENQVRLISPYPLMLDWDLQTTIKSFLCHEKVHDSLLRVMKRVLNHYGFEGIAKLGLDQFGGCLNVRKMRNGTQWSTHAWGIATDWDADRNPLRTPFLKSQMGRPEYAAFIELFEEEGWVSLGRERNFDAMHFQAARL